MSNQSIDKTINTYEAGTVTRYHTHPRLGRFNQSDAAHSWGVAALIIQLHPNPSKELLLAAILHDTGERFAGDLPAPVKRANPVLAATHGELEEYMRALTIYCGDYKLNSEDQKWLKMADMLECTMFASLTVPEILKSKAWIGLIGGIEKLSETLEEQPAIDVVELIEEAYTRQGFREYNGAFDYSKYAEQAA